ncbi:MAG: hypothetical protein R3293_22740 [Candidatus Promineifilaceae bacterium]|nr:hypothetical protein [Candidatus Promineifilaceae bacterium]
MKGFTLFLLLLLFTACQAQQQVVQTADPTAVISPIPATSPPSPTPGIQPTNTIPAAANVPPSPTVTTLPTATTPPTQPPMTRPLRTDQVLFFAKDDALWRSDMEGANTARLTADGFLGWNRDEPFFVDTRPHLSPDGRYIAQLFAPDTTRILDLGSDQEITLPGAWTTAWSPDSSTLALAPIQGESSRELWLVDPASGAINELVGRQDMDGDGRIHYIAWSPDGSQIAFDCCFVTRDPYDGFSDGAIKVVDIDTGAVAAVMETVAGIAGGPSLFCWTGDGQLTTEPALGMAHCARSLPYETAVVISVDNLQAQWAANINDEGVWESTRIFVTGANDDRIIWEQTLPLQSYTVLSWSPDGRFLFADDQSPDSPIWRISVDGQEISELLPGTLMLGIVPQWAAPAGAKAPETPS